ncbi:exodeoxyribonuclease V, alpha subunit [Deferribacter desulfuricans SSM1]|uniref:RecBCD enzyme subunit RecD n=1 Tax=Deferribacter desulfuricans (strain DSM 14783 / JCM 11476 / NBRC 101012 / SSM1) TaxID=639282 RepID=D3PC94_DEFDS|nr:exodeoxyribonuclease V subunit alpha [Deferribacter desulfuricans]BAI80217.1 exodeoxyribonuclease V, alpha subunit [Deferribacter desulfuricans SSM1]
MMVLDILLKNKIIGYFEYEVAKWVYENTKNPLIKNIFLLLAYSYENGDSCLDLKCIENRDLLEFFELDDKGLSFIFPDSEKIKSEIVKYNFLKNLVVVFDDKLFFKRIFNYEKYIADKIRELSAKKRGIKKFFYDENLNNLQNLAVSLSVINNFMVISGGPGTGKTTVIKKIIETILDNNDNHKIAITAPTGKAVSRILESLKEFPFLDKIEPPCTIHRLLGANSREMRFYYNKNNRLPFDTLIIDEVSMVDVEIFYHVLQALKDDARLILIGDKNQLSSVEAGAVLGEICSIKEFFGLNTLNFFTKNIANKFDFNGNVVENDSMPIVDCLIEFDESYRFGKNSGISRLAELIKFEKYNELEELIFSERGFDGLLFYDLNKNVIENIVDDFKKEIKENYLQALNKIKILTPFKRGDFGTEFLNFYVDKKLKKSFGATDWYTGRQLIINKNDYSNGLYNGDMGVAVVEDKKYLMFYDSLNKEYLKFPESLISGYDLGFALTVHKSQGSEFDNVYFILGNKDHQMLTKELIYTAITRAKKRVIIIGDKQILFNAIKRKTDRKSAIGKLLYES